MHSQPAQPSARRRTLLGAQEPVRDYNGAMPMWQRFFDSLEGKNVLMGSGLPTARRRQPTPPPEPWSLGGPGPSSPSPALGGLFRAIRPTR